MDNKFNLKIISRFNMIKFDDLNYVSLKTPDGERGINVNHYEFISILNDGDIKINFLDHSSKLINIKNGFFSFNKNEAIIVCDNFNENN